MQQHPIKIPLMKNAFVGEADARKALAAFIAGDERLSMGKLCQKFELEFAKFQGRSRAVLFNSGGSANLAMIQALKNLGRLKTGDRIGFSAVTWSTNVMPIIELGMEPIPVDCDPKTLNSMSGNAISTLEKENCKAFFLTNVLGLAGDLDRIRDECAKRGIIVIEDNCESLGTKLYGSMTGNFSLAASFSFFVAHHMSTIEGGMVATDDEEFADMLTVVRANGWDRNLAPDRQQIFRKQAGIDDFQAKYSFYDLGYNLRPTEITGFLGINQLPLLSPMLKIREENFLKIQKVVATNADFIPLSFGHLSTVPAFALPFILKTPELRKHYSDKFAKAGIEIRPIIAGNMQRQPFFKKYQPRTFSLPGADLIHENGFYCGNCPDYTTEELNTVISCLHPK